MTGSSTVRIKCGDDGFHKDSLDVPHHSSTGDLHRARTKVPPVSFTGDNFASMSSVLNKWLFKRCPTVAVAMNSPYRNCSASRLSSSHQGVLS